MCWVALLDRASKLGEIAGTDLAATWRAIVDEIRDDILAHGVRDGVLRQHYDTDALDASTLLAALFGFLPEDDETLRKSVEAIHDQLTEDGSGPSLPHRRDRRRHVRQGGQLPDLLVLARLGACDRRRAAGGPRPDGAPAQRRVATRPVRRGVRHEHVGRHLGNFPRRSRIWPWT